MTEAARVIELKSTTKLAQKRAHSIRIETVDPTKIVEVWKLFEHALREGDQPVPVSDDPPETVRGHLFSALHNPNLIGILAKVGRKPVGLVLAFVQHRNVGHPHRFAYIWSLWVEPEFRKDRVMVKMLRDLFERMKRLGVRHWESDAAPKLAKQLTKTRRAKIAYHRMSGEI